MKPRCWRDMRRRCLHPKRAVQCYDQNGHCQEAKEWPNVKKEIEKEKVKNWSEGYGTSG